jgi:hypothetical protein
MNNQYIKLIEELDKTISMTRTFWMDARTNEDKAKWYKRINELLDERFRLMGLRDAG